MLCVKLNLLRYNSCEMSKAVRLGSYGLRVGTGAESWHGSSGTFFAISREKVLSWLGLLSILLAQYLKHITGSAIFG